MLYFKRNLPRTERAVRLLLAAASAAAAFAVPLGPWAGLALGATALSLALSALLGFCPACAMMGRRPLDRQP